MKNSRTTFVKKTTKVKLKLVSHNVIAKNSLTLCVRKFGASRLVEEFQDAGPEGDPEGDEKENLEVQDEDPAAIIR